MDHVTDKWLDLYSATSLKQQSTVRHVAPLGHIIQTPESTSLLFLPCATKLPEKQQILIV